MTFLDSDYEIARIMFPVLNCGKTSTKDLYLYTGCFRIAKNHYEIIIIITIIYTIHPITG